MGSILAVPVDVTNTSVHRRRNPVKGLWSRALGRLRLIDDSIFLFAYVLL